MDKFLANESLTINYKLQIKYKSTDWTVYKINAKYMACLTPVVQYILFLKQNNTKIIAISYLLHKINNREIP